MIAEEMIKVLKFIDDNLNSMNLFNISFDAEENTNEIYLKYKNTNMLFAIVYVDKIKECIKYTEGNK